MDGIKAKHFSYLLLHGEPVTRFAMREILCRFPGAECFAETADAPHARELCSKSHPAIAILDLTLQRGDGLEFLRDLRTICP